MKTKHNAHILFELLLEHILPSKPHFPVDLQRKVNWENGWMNIPVDFNKFIGKPDEDIKLYLSNLGHPIIKKIKNTRNKNGAARIEFGSELAKWYQENFERSENPNVYMINPHTLFICSR